VVRLDGCGPHRLQDALGHPRRDPERRLPLPTPPHLVETSNPVLWWEIVKKKIGEQRAKWIHKAMKNRRSFRFAESDWLKVETALKEELMRLHGD
jgi:hypothetical protein